MKDYHKLLSDEISLDPPDWEEMRTLGHKMIDDMTDHLQNIRQEPSWRKIPGETKESLKMNLPQEPQAITDIYEEFRQRILPYPSGNIHPRFWAWVQGTGTPFGMLAEMLAAGMNPNTALGDVRRTASPELVQGDDELSAIIVGNSRQRRLDGKHNGAHGSEKSPDREGRPKRRRQSCDR